MFIQKFLNGITPVLLLVSGAIITLKLRGFYLFHPIKATKLLLKRESARGTSPFSALCLALAGTLGVGNIVGVASAIMLGGYGAVFWMWISAILAMSLKYAEIVISMKYREKTKDGYRGGAAYYIVAAFRRLRLHGTGEALARAFVIFCIVNSLTMGCMLQSNAISSAFSSAFKINPVIIGIVISTLFIMAIAYKSGRVERITNIIVPIMSLIYIIFCAVAIFLRRDAIEGAFALIFSDALNPTSIGGGLVGFFTSRAFRAGSMRGLISNEAGAGTAPTAHALANTQIPEKQGLMGVFEVFADTVILCTLTALVIIASGADINANDPMTLVMNSFSSIFGKSSDIFLCISIFLFAFATLLCWAKYGISSIEYLTKRKIAKRVYRVAFCALIIFGTIFTSDIIWAASDVSIAVMTIINLTSIFILRKEITIIDLKNNKM